MSILLSTFSIFIIFSIFVFAVPSVFSVFSRGKSFCLFVCGLEVYRIAQSSEILIGHPMSQPASVTQSCKMSQI